MTTTRIVLVDDHEVVRLGLLMLINDQEDLQVVGEAGDAQDALALVGRERPDVVLMDIRLPGEGGIDATRQIRELFPDTEVVILTSYLDNELIVKAIQAGAAGYVLKQLGNEELLQTLRAAARGEDLLDASTSARLRAQVRQVESRLETNPFRDLSDRDLEILAQVARGLSNAEIAAALYLSEKTVRNYISAMLRKLDMNNRVELATFAVKNRLFTRLDHGE